MAGMKCACQDVLVVCLLGYELNIKQAHISATPNMLYLCGLLKNGIVGYTLSLISPRYPLTMPALAGGSLPVLGSGKIEQFLNSKSQMLKLCNPVFSPFMLLQ